VTPMSRGARPKGDSVTAGGHRWEARSREKSFTKVLLAGWHAYGSKHGTDAE